MKKLSLLIITIMIFSMVSLLLPMNVMAANTSLNIILSQATVHPGQEFTVSVRLSDLAEIAPDGIMTIQTDLNFDNNKFTYKSIAITPEIQSLIDSGKVMLNIGGSQANKLSCMLNMNEIGRASCRERV